MMQVPAKEQNLGNLDVLRTIAVLSVFCSHAVQYSSRNQRVAINLGHAGVLLFFVHTTLVLLMSLERQVDGRSLWVRFMVRRAFRVYPLAICTVLIYFWLNFPHIVDYHRLESFHVAQFGLLANLLLIQNLCGIASVPAVLWSLPFEMQMYLILPPLYLFIRNRGREDAIALWVVSVALSLVLMGILSGAQAALFQFVPCFIAGVIAFRNRVTPILPAILFPLFVLLLAGLYLFTNPALVIAQWPLCFVLGMGIGLFRETQNSAVRVTAEKIAKYSFGIYLFHEAVLLVLLPHFGLWGAVAGFFATLAASAIAYHLVEEPLVLLGKRITEPHGSAWPHGQDEQIPPPAV